MALINCPDCRREISDQAGSCPHCGRPIADERKEKLQRIALIILVILLALYAVWTYLVVPAQEEERLRQENAEQVEN